MFTLSGVLPDFYYTNYFYLGVVLNLKTEIITDSFVNFQWFSIKCKHKWNQMVKNTIASHIVSTFLQVVLWHVDCSMLTGDDTHLDFDWILL